MTSFIPDYYVYTDGSCYNNGKINAISGIGVYFGNNDPRNISKRITGKQSNNTAELTAIIEAFNIIKNDINNGLKITIVTDSEYAIKCVSSYGKKCEDKMWNIDIPNKELVKTVYECYKDKTNVKFMHIRSHTDNNDIHSVGNDSADKLANMAIGNNKKNKKILLNVPFSEKEIIKKMGGKWDAKKKKWFVYENNKDIDNILITFPPLSNII